VEDYFGFYVDNKEFEDHRIYNFTFAMYLRDGEGNGSGFGTVLFPGDGMGWGYVRGCEGETGDGYFDLEWDYTEDFNSPNQGMLCLRWRD
jgi:hypothetical protein